MSLADERGVSFWQPSMTDPRLNTSRHIVFNLSRPEKSLLLLAPLAEAAGGWGLCREPASRERATVLAGTSEPDYQTLLAFCQAGKQQLERVRRFDMPNFHPRPEWVREMKRYGILGPEVTVNSPLDVYAVEQRYWTALWPQPVSN
jgi:hypothetical protein